MYVAVLADAVVRESTTAGVAAGLGGVGLALLGIALVRDVPEALPWSVLSVATAYAASLFAHGASVDERAPLVAAGLLLCSELATWSLDERHRFAVERGVVLARAGAVVALVLAGLAAAAVVVGLAAAPAGGGLAWSLVGTVAAVLAVALVPRLVRRA